MGTLLVSAVSDIGMITTLSTTIMFFLGLPMLILLYTSSTDKTLKTLFFGLAANMSFLSASGIAWYILSGALDAGWFIPVAKGLMVIGYVPLIYALYAVYRSNSRKLHLNAKIFIGFVNLSCLIAIAFFGLTYLSTGDPFNVAIYTLSALGDIIILGMAVPLIIINPTMRLRYVLSIIFIATLVSFTGDALNLIDAMKVSTSNVAAYSNYFYDAMLLFLAAAFLLYFIFKDDGTIALEEANKRLGDTRHAMEDLIMHMPDAACIFNQEGDVIMVNDPLLRIFNVDRRDILGKFNIFRHAEFLKCEIYDKSPFLKRGETIFIDQVMINFTGHRKAYLSMRIFPTFSQDGTISGYMSISEDITARVLAEEELKHAKELVELYIDLLGHDINNMNQVGIGYLEIALDTIDMEENKKNLLHKALGAMENSSRLIDNVKKLRRANEGNMYLRTMDLGKVLKMVIAEYSQAPGKDVTIEEHVAENAFIRANELIKDVFANLVSNAIKHSEGAISIKVGLEPVELNGVKHYRVLVEDNGPGIPDEMKLIVFDRLLRGRNRVSGGGLGLYLVKSLINNFGGAIDIEDRVPGDRKQGTRFIVTLPAAA